MRVLWLKTELLHPIDKGGKIRTFCMLRELKRDHRVTYLTLDTGSSSADAIERAGEYCHELVRVPFKASRKFSGRFYVDLALNLASSLPHAIAKYRSPALRAEIARRVEADGADVLVCDFLAPAVNVPESLACPAVLFEHNVEAVIWRRHFEVQARRLKKLYLWEQWRRMRRFERAACQRFDHVVAVSPEDRETIIKDYQVDAVSDVPTGVDTEFFRPSGGIEADANALVFTGSMDWLPNEDAVQHFVKFVLPRIAAEIPEVTLTVVGRNPSAQLMNLSRSEPRLRVTGYVDDVRPFIERAAAYVVPLRIGGGTRLKIFEAMAMERAVVSTRVGMEGLPVEDGRELLVADAPEDFARAVVRLLRERDFARALGWRAAQRVRASFGWDAAAARFAAICDTAVRGGSPAPHAEGAGRRSVASV